MKTSLNKEIYINMSHCDQTSHLGTANAFGLFLDLATEHAESIGIGTALMKSDHIFWVTARTRVHFYRRPHMTQLVKAETFMGPGRGPKAARYYRLTQGDEVLVEGKTDFVAMNLATGQMVKITDFFPSQDEITEALKDRDLPLPESAPRIQPDFSGDPVLGIYQVRSTDIDLGGHMNNVAYLRALMSFFSCEEQKEMAISDVDIAYRKPCFEGEQLEVRIRRTEGALELAMLKEDSSPAVLVRIL